MVLKGKTAIITGGSGGIGNFIVEEFLKEGANLLVVDKNQERLEKTQANFSSAYAAQLRTLAGDIGDFDFSQKVVTEAIKTFGTLDIVVNAAGIHGEIGPLWEGDPKEWEAALKVNLLGTYYMMRAAIPEMIRHGAGKIINFSGGGSTGSRPYFSSYAASKTAVVRITEIVADELKEKGHNIQVNAVAPGAINTTILNDIINAGPDKAGREYELIQKIQKEGGEDPKKVAGLVAFLASAGSGRLTGRLISAVHDTWHEIPKHTDEIMNSDIYTLRRIKPIDRGHGWK